MNSSTEHLAPAAEFRWSAKTTPSMSPYATPDPEKTGWQAPPVPPIPTAKEEEAWRRRSYKRQSLTSQMSGGALYQQAQSMASKPDRTIRPISQFSTTSTIEVRRGRSARKKPPEPDVYGSLHWDINPLNPRNWSRRKKWAHTIAIAAVAFATTFASSIVAPARVDLIHNYNISSTVAVLPTSVFVAGLAFGPLLSRLLRKAIGVKLIQIVFLPLSAALTAAAAFVPTMYGVAITRCFAGVFAGAALSIGSGSLSDIWACEERTAPLKFYHLMYLLGPPIDLLIGGYAVQYEGYRWTQFIILIALAACFAPVVLVSETSKTIILRRHRKPALRETSESDTSGAALIAPLRILFTEPIVLGVGTPTSLQFSVLYASIVAFPRIFSNAYAFDLGTQGLTPVSMVVGLALAVLAMLLFHVLIYKPRVDDWQTQRSAEAEKARRWANRSSYTSTKSAVSNFSRPNLKRIHDSKVSVAMSMTRLSTATTKSVVPPMPTFDQERNTSLATAAADYLNGLDINEGKRILPERIMLILNKNPAFGDLCAQLENYGLRMDRVQFAKVMVDALQPGIALDHDRPMTSPELPAPVLLRSKSMHRQATTAALEIQIVGSPPPVSRPSIKAAEISMTPPAEWRLWVALPASILSPGSLFLFAWTARHSIHWRVPCVGMGLLASSALLIFVAGELYLQDRYGERDGQAAVAGATVLRYLLSFGFVMFALPMYDQLGTAWATSSLGFIGLVFGAIPWVLVYNKRRR